MTHQKDHHKNHVDIEKHMRTLIIDNTYVPKFFYGTAWKEEKTADLVFQALQAGFTAIDTANQRKHYNEEGVGQGIKKYLELKLPDSHRSSDPLKLPAQPEPKSFSRQDLFLQTKFTFSKGQDHRKPYNENDSFTEQVSDSFASSLKHLNTDYLDSYILHGPYHNHGIGEEDIETWAAMEKHFDNKQVQFLGVSNISANQLTELCKKVRVQPRFVQNRCFARMGWDKEVRDICQSEGLVYQGFSLLTANSRELALPAMTAIAQKHKKTLAQVVFRFSQQLGMISLTGTTNVEHMRLDLDIYDFELSANEMSQIENISF